jgi:transcriptional regulator with XRE-family HTH domain
LREEVHGTPVSLRRSPSGERISTLQHPVGPRPIVIDPHRSVIFPNRIRELRTANGFPKLLALAAVLPDIPYIRLSKIERGEVVARADEVERIAGLLGVAARDLLVDVDDPDFDIARWSEPFADGKAADRVEEEFAVLLGAAMRARRARSDELTIAAIERDYELPPVILSRIEKAVKTLNRWNDATVVRICRFFEVADEAALRAAIAEQHRAGLLDDYFHLVTDPDARLEKSRAHLAKLLKDIDGLSAAKPPSDDRYAELHNTEPVDGSDDPDATRGNRTKLQLVRLLPLLGAPLAGGLIAPIELGQRVESPRSAGPRAFGLRIFRPTLGAGLPANAVVIVDPDVFPSSGGLAVLREDGNFRVLAIAFDGDGAMIGRSVNPALELPLDSVDPADIMAIISASFI